MSTSAEEQEQKGQPRSTGLRRWGRLSLGAVLSILFLLLALRGVQLDQVAAALRQANLALVALGTLLVVLSNVTKAIRWQAILRPYAPQVALRRLFSVLMIGQGMNAFAPLRVGDIARGYMVEGVGVGTALYSVVVEKSVDSLVLLGLLMGIAFVMPLPDWLKRSGILLAVGMVLVLVVLVMAGRGSRYVIAAASWLERTFSPLQRLALSQRAGRAAGVMRSLSQAHVMAAVMVWTALSWGLGVANNVILFDAMHLQMANPWLAGTFLIIVLYLGAIVPSSPGKIGIFEYLAVISLQLFGVDKADALAYAIILHINVYGTTALLGAYYVWRESQARGRTPPAA